MYIAKGALRTRGITPAIGVTFVCPHKSLHENRTSSSDPILAAQRPQYRVNQGRAR